MPKRMIRDWTDSQKFDGLTAEAERLFVRLIMKADDYGRFHAEPRLVRGLCFPLLDSLRTEHVGRWLDDLHHRNLLFRYEAEGQKFLAIINFGQRLKQSRAKFPPPEGENADWLPTSGNFREVAGSRPPEEEEEEEEEYEDEGKKKPLEREVVEAWNAVPEFQSVRNLSDGRKKALKARMSEPFFRENWREGIARIAKSDFCKGINGSGWKADIDFFLRPDSLSKIMEGKYDSRSPHSAASARQQAKRSGEYQLEDDEQPQVWRPEDGE